MIRTITVENIGAIRNKSFLKYAQIYSNRESATLKNIETFGVPLQERKNIRDKKQKISQLENLGAIVRNNTKSIFTNRISSACEACQMGTGSYTTYASLKCHRNCYFCFNPNQDDYTFYKDNEKDIKGELMQLLGSGAKLDHLALTGGEPLLFKEETIAFFELANRETPHTYTRIYTTGDMLDEDLLIRLKETNLDEIRFSIKMEDSFQKIKHILGKIELAKKYIPNILVEMPVIPGTLDEMKELLLELDKIGIFGINLLEFCFPLGNANEFTKRGFELKNPPYEMYYNYWYAGGLAVAESEEACLELLNFAIKENLNLGVHYCSLENKYTGQIYQQNINQKLNDPTYYFSNKDYFFKTAKVFGKDCKKVQSILENHQIPYTSNRDHDFIQFPVEAIVYLKNKNMELSISSNVVELEGRDLFIREVSLDWTTPDFFEIEDIQ